jgi:hypothetical protein
MTSQFKYGLFLSHSWKNNEFVKTFKAKVDAKGVKCWIDTERIAAGDELTQLSFAFIKWLCSVLCYLLRLLHEKKNTSELMANTYLREI